MKKLRGIFPSIAMAVTLLLGTTVAWATAAFLADKVLEQLLPSEETPNEDYQILAIARDGTPLLRSWSRTDDEGRPVYRSLDGKKVDLPEDEVQGVTIHISPADGPETPAAGLDWNSRIWPFTPPRDAGTCWYFIHDGQPQGAGYFVGYDTRSKLKIGYIGRQGFRADEPPPEEQFRVAGYRLQVRNACIDGYSRQAWNYEARIRLKVPGWKACLLADEGLLEIDLNGHTVRSLLEGSDLISARIVSEELFADTPRDKLALGAERSFTVQERICGTKAFYERTVSASPDLMMRDVLLVQRADRIVLLDRDGREAQSYRIPDELREKEFRLMLLGSSKALACVSPEWGNGEERDKLFWFDVGGKILRRETVVLPRRKSSFGSRNLILPALLIQSPVVCVRMAGNILPQTGADDPQDANLWSNPADTLITAWPAVIASLAGVVATVLCYRRQRAYGLRGTWCWTLVVFVFGIPGYLAYLAHRRWPTRLPCPACEHIVPRDRPACFVCRENFPRPALTGTEVFA